MTEPNSVINNFIKNFITKQSDFTNVKIHDVSTIKDLGNKHFPSNLEKCVNIQNVCLILNDNWDKDMQIKLFNNLSSCYFKELDLDNTIKQSQEVYSQVKEDQSNIVLLKCMQKHAQSLYKLKHYKQSNEIIDKIPEDKLTEDFIQLKSDNLGMIEKKDQDFLEKQDRKQMKLMDEIDQIDLDAYFLQPIKGQFEQSELYQRVNSLDKKHLRKLAQVHNNWISKNDRFFKENEMELFGSNVEQNDVQFSNLLIQKQSWIFIDNLIFISTWNQIVERKFKDAQNTLKFQNNQQTGMQFQLDEKLIEEIASVNGEKFWDTVLIPWNMLFLKAVIMVGLKEFEKAEQWMCEFLLSMPHTYMDPECMFHYMKLLQELCTQDGYRCDQSVLIIKQFKEEQQMKISDATNIDWDFIKQRKEELKVFN